MALIKCPECEREISDKAISCPYCGYPIAENWQDLEPKEPMIENSVTKSTTYIAPNYAKNYENPKQHQKKSGCLPAFLIVLGLVVLVFILFPKEYIPGNNLEETKESIKTTSELKSNNPTASPIKEPKEDYMKSCKKYDYKKLLRDPDDYIGKRINLKVKISQVMDGGWFDDGTYYRCYTDNEGYDVYFDDEYYIADARTEKDVKLLNDDVITVYGEYIGCESLTRALTGTQDEIPKINMFYVKLHEEKESE